MEKGYKLVEVYEVMHFPKTSNTLFSDYISTFNKLKKTYSDWPVNCVTDEDKEEYIRCCKEKEKIEIDKDQVCKNPGLRNVAKIMLNSFWGKFAQRDDLTKSKFCYEAHEFYELLMDDTLEVLDAHFFSNHLLYTTYRTKEAFTHSSKNANIFIAAFTTAWARLKLYTLLEQLGERALYFDTDSVIYSVKSE